MSFERERVGSGVGAAMRWDLKSAAGVLADWLLAASSFDASAALPLSRGISLAAFVPVRGSVGVATRQPPDGGA